MSSLTGRLTITEGDLGDWRNWTLEQPLVYSNGSLSVTVPSGFVTDGASVPRMFWWLTPAWGRYSRAAVVHDYICRQLAAGNPIVSSRSEADAVFYDAMRQCGVNTTIRFLMWAAVRVFAIIARR